MGRLSLRLAGETPVDAYVRTCGRVDVRQADAGDLSAIGTSRIGLRERRKLGLQASANLKATLLTR